MILQNCPVYTTYGVRQIVSKFGIADSCRILASLACSGCSGLLFTEVCLNCHATVVRCKPRVLQSTVKKQQRLHYYEYIADA